MKLPSLTTIGTKFADYERHLVHEKGLKAQMLHTSFVLMCTLGMTAAALVFGSLVLLALKLIFHWPILFFCLVGGLIAVGLYDFYLFARGKK